MTTGIGIDNIYHCCVFKTGSQWIKTILSDEMVSQQTNMSIYTYQKHLPTRGDPRHLTKRIFDKPFPTQKIISPLYLDYDCYQIIPKPPDYKTFFISRDPRDIVISWYYSVKYSHPIMGKIDQHRKTLHDIPLKEGMIYCIKYLNDFGLFAALRSWHKIRKKKSPIMIIRFEDLIDLKQQTTIFTNLFSHCQIPLSKQAIKNLLSKYSFKNMQMKQKKKVSAYRRGIPGDWKNHFNPEIMAVFKELSMDLPSILGYGD